jgi:salicylate hydroxylase
VPEIAVVGAGIAGLALAAALRRRGFSSVVFEQATELTGIGAGVQIAPNASRLLHRLGLARRLREVAVRPAATEFRRWADDQLIGRITLGDECERLYGAPYYTIHRADLRDALASVVCNLTVCLGRRLVAMRETSDCVVLDFADGSSYPASMAAGADGIGSIVRKTLAADKLAADNTVFSGLGAYRGLVPAAAVPEFAREPAVRLWLGPGRHLVCYPVSGGRFISFAAITPCEVAGCESWAAAGTAEDLAEAFRGWNQAVQRLIAGAREIGYWALYDREPLPRLATSRLALIGDAAHPMLPFVAQGANQAIEDALALAACLTDGSDSGMAGAALRYESCRAPRTARLQRQARSSIDSMHLPDGVAQRSRDKALEAGMDLRHQAWLYAYDAEGECLL